MTGTSIRPGGPLAIGVAALLLALFAVQAVASMRLLTASGDETVHLPAGYSYLRTGDLRLNPEHPPLIKQLCALPLLLLDVEVDFDSPHWRSSPPNQAAFGYDLLYSNDADRLLFWGRLPVVCLGLLLGVYVYLWASALFGRLAGLTALFLYAFGPNLIAHGRFVTMDLGLSCFFVICLYHAWRYVRRGRWSDLILTGFALGLALATKFSAVILVPTLIVLLALAVTGREENGAPGVDRWSRAATALSIVLVVAGLLVWTFYLFPADPLFYLDGMKQVNENHRPDYAEYLMGDFELDGWWYYFLVAFLVKTPLPTILLLLSACALFRRCRAERAIDEAFLVVPALTFFVVTSALADNIGVRYILPVYPLLFVFVSRVSGFLSARRAGVGLMLVLGAWYVFGAVRIYPDHLAYFNEAAGGPRNGHRWLDDSNVDWGNDLKRLGSYMEREGIERVRLLPGPWNGNPGYYGIRWDPVTRGEWRDAPLPGETYVLSTHMLIRGQLIAKRQGTNNDWLNRYEPVGRVGYSFYLFRFD